MTHPERHSEVVMNELERKSFSVKKEACECIALMELVLWK